MKDSFEKKLKTEYLNGLSRSAPDMDRLWERIESNLPERPKTEKIRISRRIQPDNMGGGTRSNSHSRRHFIHIKQYQHLKRFSIKHRSGRYDDKERSGSRRDPII